jgi:PiT family inorganic phosphate transporter
VRWQYAVPVLTSWLVTLPASFAVAALVGLALARLG